MKTLWFLLPVAGLVCASRAEVIHFDNLPTNALPSGWLALHSGDTAPRWTVERDDSAPSRPNVLKQSGEAAFALCVQKDTQLRDGFVEVKFKPIAGEDDQAGGVVWRVKDADNYYVCRANARENNVVLYKMQAGKRQALDIVGREGGYGVKTPVAGGQWHTLRVAFAGSRFKVIFNGKALFEVEDATFAEAGKVGVWTKADSVTVFDDFRTPLPAP
jgi:hypothetical protein